jgi:hypothetical protein
MLKVRYLNLGAHLLSDRGEHRLALEDSCEKGV